MSFSFAEKPPIVTGQSKKDIENLRDYLFRMAQSLGDAAGANAATDNAGVSISYKKDGTQVLRPVSSSGTSDKDIAAVRKNAQELRSLIIKSAKDLNRRIDSNGEGIIAGDNAVMNYVDSKTEVYNSMYLARSEFGTFQENVTSMIETTAKGVVESYDYGSSIESVQNSIGLLQSYYTSINGEIRRGIVEDPETGEYVTGIAIAQSLKFSGECGPSDPKNPGDGYTYYYMNSGQTFGLYTSVGWQFWIDGHKKGWYSSQDGMLHVANVLVEQVLQIGSSWQIKSSGDGSELEILYVGS